MKANQSGLMLWIILVLLAFTGCEGTDMPSEGDEHLTGIPPVVTTEVPGELLFNGTVWKVSAGQSINATIKLAKQDDIILVSEGTFNENIVINKRIALLGGGDGSGDPDKRVPTMFVSVIYADPASAAVSFLNDSGASSSGAKINGFTITNGRHGIETFNRPANIVISNNVIHANGMVSESRDERGGGLKLSGDGFQVKSNIIRDNFSGMGGGLFCNCSDIWIVDNMISGNIAYSDHGGAMYLAGNPIHFQDNVVERNTVSGTAGSNGSGGGIFIDGKTTVAYVHNCISRYNHANSYGAGLSSDSGSTIYADHVLVYGNTSGQCAPGIYISAGDPEPGTLYLSFCTVFGNRSPSDSTGNGLDARGGTAIVKNCVFWNSDGKTLWAVPDPHMKDKTIGGIIKMADSITDTTSAWPGTENLTDDPLFVNASAGDFHIGLTGVNVGFYGTSE